MAMFIQSLYGDPAAHSTECLLLVCFIDVVLHGDCGDSWMKYTTVIGFLGTTRVTCVMLGEKMGEGDWNC